MKALCTVEGCDKAIHARGLCPSHYAARLKLRAAVCSIEGCDSPSLARGWCSMHWQRWQVWGDPMATPNRASKEYILLRITVDENGCWLWTRAQNGSGYGVASVSHKYIGAHCLAYELFVGPIPEGLTLDHLCRVRHCVNPSHLEPVTPRVNTLRGNAPSALNAVKTHCIHGHEFTPENTIRDRKGRSCRACKTERDRRHRSAQKRARERDEATGTWH